MNNSDALPPMDPSGFFKLQTLESIDPVELTLFKSHYNRLSIRIHLQWEDLTEHQKQETVEELHTLEEQIRNFIKKPWKIRCILSGFHEGRVPIRTGTGSAALCSGFLGKK